MDSMRLVPDLRRQVEARRLVAFTGFCRVCAVLLGAAGLAFLVAVAMVGRSQVPGERVGPPGSDHIYYPEHPSTAIPSPNYDSSAALLQRRLNALNIQRQKQIVSDTNKLLRLAKELNDEVAVSNTDSLTQDQLRKIAEIEKLARNVKERMADGVGQPEPPLIQSPLVYPAQ